MSFLLFCKVNVRTLKTQKITFRFLKYAHFVLPFLNRPCAQDRAEHLHLRIEI